MNHNDKMPDFNDGKGRIMPPIEVARHMRLSSVGLTYKTHGEVWDAAPEIRITGLLELILGKIEAADEARSQGQKLEKHCEWFNDLRYRDEMLLARHKKQLARIGRFVDVRFFSQWVCAGYRLAFLGDAYCGYGRKKYGELIRSILDEIETLKNIKRIDDLTKLDGVGPATIKKIKKRIEESK